MILTGFANSLAAIARTVVIALFSIAPAHVLAQAEPDETYIHAESGYRFPFLLETDLLMFVRSKVGDLQDSRPGISVAYDSGFSCFVDFYLYKAALIEVPDGAASHPAQIQFARSASQIFRIAEEDHWTDFKRTSLPGTLVPASARAPAFMLDTFEYRLDGRPFMTSLLLTGSRNHFLEIRYTCSAFSDWSNKPYVILLLPKILASFFEANSR